MKSQVLFLSESWLYDGLEVLRVPDDPRDGVHVQPLPLRLPELKLLHEPHGEEEGLRGGQHLPHAAALAYAEGGDALVRAVAEEAGVAVADQEAVGAEGVGVAPVRGVVADAVEVGEDLKEKQKTHKLKMLYTKKVLEGAFLKRNTPEFLWETVFL